MKIIKLSTPWQHDFYSQTPGGKGIFGDYRFEIDNDCSECDFWIVWGDLKHSETVKCNPNHVIYLTDETHDERVFREEFLSQFAAVIACRTDLSHKNIIPSHDLGIWHFKSNYDNIIATKDFEKKHTLSMVASDKTQLPGHKKRFAFFMTLRGHFKDRMHAYGRGINPIDDKLEGIAPYLYTIAVENSFINGYFTEKLFEAFLSYTFPFYYGCPDLEKYFDDRSFIRIDIDDYISSIDIIEEALRENIYHERRKYIEDSRSLFINEYHVFPSLIKILNNYTPSNLPKKWVKLRTESHFVPGYRQKIKRIFKP